mmetsp:Transcript_11078/g.18108  ORF Transcript_11078/g.18108 Transcript_11078/m.18108 type:complete len:131 (+) Transcript_11078:100-492(+)
MADVPQDDYAIEQPPEANLEQIEPEQRNAPPQLEGPNPPARVPHVRLRTCGGCNKQEGYRHEFKVCSRCRQVRYCGRECQAADWQRHRQHCVPVGRLREIRHALRNMNRILDYPPAHCSHYPLAHCAPGA